MGIRNVTYRGPNDYYYSQIQTGYLGRQMREHFGTDWPKVIADKRVECMRKTGMFHPGFIGVYDGGWSASEGWIWTCCRKSGNTCNGLDVDEWLKVNDFPGCRSVGEGLHEGQVFTSS